MNIKSKINNYTYYYKIQIVCVTEGWSRILKDGEWVNHTYDTNEDVIVEIGKCFDTTSDAEVFIESKQFKSLFKVVEKNAKMMV